MSIKILFALAALALLASVGTASAEPACEDNSDNCFSATSLTCTREEWKENCPWSCNLCGCYDHEEVDNQKFNCESLAKGKQCHLPAVQWACRKSCGSCGKPGEKKLPLPKLKKQG